MIYNKNGDIVGSIAKSQNLYRVTHQPAGLSHVAEALDEPAKLSVMELHCHMGHIVPTAAKMLVVNGMWQVSPLSIHWNRFNVKLALKPSRQEKLFRKFDRGSRQWNSGRKSIQIFGGQQNTLH